ncbi:MAG: pitrilysin family protein [Pyrinomonadaceae bacterium]
MNYTKKLKTFTILALFLFQFASTSFAQTTKFSEPRQEKLLNGLKLLTWNEPNADKITIKLRIHSGSAFDPQGKEGVMALLADALFPNESQREFFAEDLGGSLDVTSNFDYIQINATGKSDQFLTMMETLATAVTNPQFDKEITAKVVAARLEKVKELEKNPSYIADQAVAKRLFGDFPYGRAQMGTNISLAKIDFADLLFAKQRFLTADNATLAVIGKVKSEFAYSVVRRYFGGWEKADKKVPATFRQPDAPDTKQIIVNSPLIENSEIRYAMRGLARNDKDFASSSILIKIMQNRLSKKFPQENKNNFFVRQNSNLLPGLITVGISNLSLDGKPSSDMIAFRGENLPAILVTEKISIEEFEKAKNEAATEMNQKNLADLWLDVDTFKLNTAKAEFQKINDVSIADVQKIAERLTKEPTATVLIVKSKEEKK